MVHLDERRLEEELEERRTRARERKRERVQTLACRLSCIHRSVRHRRLALASFHSLRFRSFRGLRVESGSSHVIAHRAGGRPPWCVRMAVRAFPRLWCGRGRQERWPEGGEKGVADAGWGSERAGRGKRGRRGVRCGATADGARRRDQSDATRSLSGWDGAGRETRPFSFSSVSSKKRKSAGAGVRLAPPESLLCARSDRGWSNLGVAPPLAAQPDPSATPGGAWVVASLAGGRGVATGPVLPWPAGGSLRWARRCRPWRPG